MSVFDKKAVVLALEELATAFRYTASTIRKMDIESFNKNEFANELTAIADKFVTLSEHTEAHGEAALTNKNDLNWELRVNVNTVMGFIGGIAATSLFVAAAASLGILVTGVGFGLVGIGVGLGVGELISFLESAGFTFVSKNLDFSNEDGDHIIVGSHLADTIVSSKGDDTVQGLAFSDDIVNPGGSDSIDGGLGRDIISYQDAPSFELQVEDGKLLVLHGNGEDTLTSVEVIHATNKDDVINLDLTPHLDESDLEVYLEAGNDIYNASPLSFQGTIKVYGGEGTDSVFAKDNSEGVTINLDSGLVSYGSNATGRVYAYDFEDVYGTDHDDQLTGNDADNIIDGGDGKDELIGGAGDD